MDAASFQKATAASPDQMAAVLAYRQLLEAANDRLNLVGPSAMAEFWGRHAYDSWQLLSAAPEARRWADLGAGAGFPGVILAIFMRTDERAQVNLIESRQKRAAFLSEVVNALDLPVIVHNARAEDLRLSVDVVTARACAPLIDLLGYALPTLREGSIGLFLKGEAVDTEIATAREAWSFDASLAPSLSDPRGRVLRVKRLKRRVRSR